MEKLHDIQVKLKDMQEKLEDFCNDSRFCQLELAFITKTCSKIKPGNRRVIDLTYRLRGDRVYLPGGRR